MIRWSDDAEIVRLVVRSTPKAPTAQPARKHKQQQAAASNPTKMKVRSVQPEGLGDATHALAQARPRLRVSVQMSSETMRGGSRSIARDQEPAEPLLSLGHSHTLLMCLHECLP